MKGKFYLALVWVLGVAVPGVQAQESGIQVGAATLYPTLGLGVGYDDNVTLAPVNELSSWYYLISPALRLQTGSGRSTYVFEYGLDFVEYKDSDPDSYLDQHLSALWQYLPTVRDEFSLRGGIDFGHDRRGEGLGDFLPGRLQAEVDEFDAYSLNAFYRHGADGAKGRIQVEAGWFDKEYQNNREVTRIGDHQRVHINGAFFWRVANKSSLLLEAGVSQTDYTTANRDNDEYFVGVGVKWEATARTEGRASYRQLNVDFDDDTQSGYDGDAWQLAVTWTPRVYSVVQISALRSTEVAFGRSNLLVREAVDFSWRHEWRPRFSTFMDAGFANEEFQPSLREDDLYFYGVGASYSARYWLDIGLSFRRFERESTRNLFDYERNEFLLSFELSL